MVSIVVHNHLRTLVSSAFGNAHRLLLYVRLRVVHAQKKNLCLIVLFSGMMNLMSIFYLDPTLQVLITVAYHLNVGSIVIFNMLLPYYPPNIVLLTFSL